MNFISPDQTLKELCILYITNITHECLIPSLLPSGHLGHHVGSSAGGFDPDRSAQELQKVPRVG